jgi:Zn-finger nucleic acid-binding protein
MVIINMPRRTLAKIAEFAIIIEEKLPMKRKNMAKYHQNDSNSDEFDDSNNEDEHHEKKTKKKSKKVDFDIVKKGVYCQKCFDEGHFTK